MLDGTEEQFSVTGVALSIFGRQKRKFPLVQNTFPAGLVLLLVLVNLASGRAVGPPEVDSPGKPTVREEVLGSLPLLALSGSTVASEDGQHIAMLVRHGWGFTVWHDGQEGDVYRQINQPVFSPKGARLAYVATKDERTDLVVVDGKVLAEQTSISPRSLRFSPDGKRVVFVAATPTNRAIVIPPVTAAAADGGEPDSYVAIVKLVVVLDGKPGHPYFGINTRDMVFSPDSSQLAYSASPVLPGTAGVTQECVVCNGVESELWEAIREGTLTFSPDSRHLAFAARRQGKWQVVVDGKPGRAYDGIGSPSLTFASRGARLAYLAERDGKRFPVDAGEEGVPAGMQDPARLQFSPDGSKLAYSATRNGKKLWLINQAPAAEYDELGPLLFSPDSRHTAYVASRRSRFYMVFDGAESQACEEIAETFQFSPDSAHLIWLGKRDGKYRLVCDLEERGREYDSAGRLMAVSPDGRHVAFAAATGRDHAVVVLDGVDGPAYDGDIFKLAFQGNRTLHVIARRMNPNSFKDEIVRVEMLLPEPAAGLLETPSR